MPLTLAENAIITLRNAPEGTHIHRNEIIDRDSSLTVKTYIASIRTQANGSGR
jgi:hypothetical protein